MENVVLEDSPLAEFLEGMRPHVYLHNKRRTLTAMQGEGRGEDSRPPSPAASLPEDNHDFAPRGPSTLHSRIREKLPKPLRIHERHGSIARIHTACSVRHVTSHENAEDFADCNAQKAVNSRLGRADNERFLEHFRYLIVASQLLGDQGGMRTAALPNSAADGHAAPLEFKVATINPAGATLTAGTAFLLVWMVHWSRRRSGFSKGRLIIVLVVFAAVATTVYGYTRRQWLQYLRREAVDGASALVTNLQAFEASTSSALALIQEVELVSRGYRLYVFWLKPHNANITNTKQK